MGLPQPLLTTFSKVVLNQPVIGKPLFRGLLRLAGMPMTGRFIEYVMDFEHAYKNDDWSIVEPYFAPDAVYEVRNTYFDCHLEGPKAIIKGFKSSLNGFDRQLKRSLKVTDGPHEDGSKITFGWVGEYSTHDHPPLIISAQQTAHYRDDLITFLTDEYPPGEGQRIADWIDKHDLNLDPNYR